MGWLCDLCQIKKCKTCVMNQNCENKGCFEYDGELFETKADMLEYAIEHGIKVSDVIHEIADGISATEAVEIVQNYGDIDDVCNAFLVWSRV